MKTVTDFADLYLKGNIKLPVSSNITTGLSICRRFNTMPSHPLKEFLKEFLTELKRKVSEIEHNSKLSTFKGLKLSPGIKAKICISLHELTRAIVASNALRKINAKTVKQRRDTAKHLEKVLQIDYLFLNTSLKKSIQTEIEKLKAYDKKKEYHPLLDVVFMTTLSTFNTPSILGDHLKQRQENIHKLLEMLNSPLKTEEGRPSKFFSNVLQIVIYKLLNEESQIPVEKAKKLTAQIINNYLDKMGHSSLAVYTAKRVDNALHP